MYTYAKQRWYVMIATLKESARRRTVVAGRATVLAVAEVLLLLRLDRLTLPPSPTDARTSK